MTDSSLHFNLFERRGFWTADECRRLREVCATSRVEEAGIYSEGKLSIDGRFRKTARILLHDSHRMEIHNSILSVKAELEDHFSQKLNGLQPFQFLQYRRGDYFYTHQDERRAPSEISRKFSIIIFLNSKDSAGAQFDGGDVIFYRNIEESEARLGLRIVPDEGQILAFSSYLLHEVTEVISGVRYSIVGWFF